MKQALVVISLLALIVSVAGADVLYRETFNYEGDAYWGDTLHRLTGGEAHWGSFYVKQGSPMRNDRFWGTLNPNSPLPTANSYQTRPNVADGNDAISQSIKVIDCRFIVGTMSPQESFDYWGGMVDWNSEYKPNFHDVPVIQFDLKVNSNSDDTHALIYTGGHWYVTQEAVYDPMAGDGLFRTQTINWQSSHWNQLVDDIDQWKTWADPNAPFVAFDVSTAGFGTVDTFGFMNWNTRANMSYDNITLTPEPATMSLLALGVAGLLRRRA
jgi:hypothetical protein